MEKLTGLKKIKTAVFISGTGSNLKNIIKFSKIKKSPISINLIISNTYLAKGLKYAEQFKIKKKIFNFKDYNKAEKKILILLKKEKIEFICLAGYMKILSAGFIKKFGKRIINIHPSLLPKYKGLNTHSRAIKNKDKLAGCTVHYVAAKLDSGKIILQKKVKISVRDNPASLKKKVLKQEHKLYPAAIIKIFN
ncbi:phosphoribosylglycinamide formyltransferase [Candidatus Pelagibacter sp.]|nr:phosphoribosylglycinamide formyltransferase [Candidatus Pelagibacter bacterium]MDC0364638.1 phosphoribosylglycinamide formyltransferase [Candidatus Pelagibacter sp.]MDC0448814.1 phosphoribosylglycinamide formyltransferase [Candidatus Pelagibacter sp.]MDC1082432.1 phosphoribosylglycinamide formyltransferase [Candidatus Pelagibacter sp.]